MLLWCLDINDSHGVSHVRVQHAMLNFVGGFRSGEQDFELCLVGECQILNPMSRPPLFNTKNNWSGPQTKCGWEQGTLDFV